MRETYLFVCYKYTTYIWFEHKFAQWTIWFHELITLQHLSYFTATAYFSMRCNDMKQIAKNRFIPSGGLTLLREILKNLSDLGRPLRNSF